MPWPQLFQNLAVVSLLGSFLALGIFIIKALWGWKLNANWHYAVWFVLILRLCLLFSVTSSFSILNLIPYQQTMELPVWPTTAADELSAVNIDPGNGSANDAVPESWIKTGDLSPTAGANESPINWETAALVWLVGLGAILLYLLAVNTAMYYKIKKLPRCAAQDILNLLDECKANLNIKNEVKVVYDRSLGSPALFGIFNPRIIIAPEVIRNLSPQELRYIFLHELSHLKRHDLLVNGLLLIIQAVYWFNPLIWYALRQMKRDCEIACDATVLNHLKPQDRKPYGQTIISLLQLLAKPHWAPGTLGYVSKFNKRRIVMISSNKKTSVKWVVAALAALLLVGCSSLNAPGKTTGQGTNQPITDTAASNHDTAGSNQPDANTGTVNTSNSAPASSLVYKNTQYGFEFSLPAGWQGYSIITSDWQGNEVQSGKITETGPLVSIRHPQWTSSNPRQDIPVMIFTLNQWNLVQQEKLSVGAAPIGPTELGRNRTYVFALPARYNYAFPTGFEEVENIIASHPLKAY
ncbi:MAG: M56 family metallopeptidase [Syntrophomonadaceae bacterium]|nr:M56 family metallopeptidase [Syntrophomonadaceae bacterium]